jgi:uncharacterized protein YukE
MFEGGPISQIVLLQRVRDGIDVALLEIHAVHSGIDDDRQLHALVAEDLHRPVADDVDGCVLEDGGQGVVEERGLPEVDARRAAVRDLAEEIAEYGDRFAGKLAQVLQDARDDLERRARGIPDRLDDGSRQLVEHADGGARRAAQILE